MANLKLVCDNTPPEAQIVWDDTPYKIIMLTRNLSQSIQHFDAAIHESDIIRVRTHPFCPNEVTVRHGSVKIDIYTEGKTLDQVHIICIRNENVTNDFFCYDIVLNDKSLCETFGSFGMPFFAE